MMRDPRELGGAGVDPRARCGPDSGGDFGGAMEVWL